MGLREAPALRKRGLVKELRLVRSQYRQKRLKYVEMGEDFTKLLDVRWATCFLAQSLTPA